MAMFPYVIMRGNGQRFTYLSTAVFSFVVANLLYNFLAKQFLHQPHLFKRTMVVSGLLIVVFNLGIIYERSYWWRKAGKTCEQAIHQAAEIISSNPENSTIYFSNLPKRIHGAYIMPLRNSFGESMKPFVSTSNKEIMDLEIYEESELKDMKNLKADYLFYYKGGTFMKIEVAN
jgi:hypothetical protein